MYLAMLKIKNTVYYETKNVLYGRDKKVKSTGSFYNKMFYNMTRLELLSIYVMSCGFNAELSRTHRYRHEILYCISSPYYINDYYIIT